jgi:replicative DNA helicase
MISSQSIQYSNEAFSSRIFKVASVPDEKMHRIIYRNVGKLSQMPIFIDDRTALTAQAIKNTILKLRRNFDIKVIFIDRLGLMKHPTTKNSRLDIEMGLTVQFLKNIAKDLNITVVLLHQLRRSVEGRADKRPFLSELRECGALEEDADIIWFIYRESYYNKKSDDNTTEMIIAKNRDGKTGKINLMFLPEYTTFIKIDDESEEPPAEIVGVVVGVGGGGGVGGGVGDEK